MSTTRLTLVFVSMYIKMLLRVSRLLSLSCPFRALIFFCSTRSLSCSSSGLHLLVDDYSFHIDGTILTEAIISISSTQVATLMQPPDSSTLSYSQI